MRKKADRLLIMKSQAVHFLDYRSLPFSKVCAFLSDLLKLRHFLVA